MEMESFFLKYIDRLKGSIDKIDLNITTKIVQILLNA